MMQDSLIGKYTNHLMNSLYEFTINSREKKRNLHPGNVLYHIGPQIEVGLSILETEADAIKDIKGVMPFIAPELFNGGSYSQAADIYAFGMIMWEISSEEKPFRDLNHDEKLALRIYKGLRPEITNDTPPFYRDLMEKCWHADPTKRPTAKEICKLSMNWRSNKTKEFRDQIQEAEKIHRRNKGRNKKTKTSHPRAIYTSRL